MAGKLVIDFRPDFFNYYQQLILKAPSAALHAIGHKIRPYELDDSRVVVAIRQIVIERRKAVLLAGFLHSR